MNIRRICIVMLCCLLGCRTQAPNAVTAPSAAPAQTAEPEERERRFTGTALTYSQGDDEVRIQRPDLWQRVPMGVRDTWTVFVYLCGSNLESDGGAASADMEEMIEGSRYSNVRFVVETGGSLGWNFNDGSTIPYDRNQRFVIQNGRWERVWDGPHAAMGDSSTLASFLKWGVSYYASEHMGVILWDHGGGSVVGVCYDEVDDYEYDRHDLLTLRELDASFLSVFRDMTDKFAFIGFDACLMSTIEAANIMASYADYMIASAESEPARGWDYEAMGKSLGHDPDMSADTLGRYICDSYLASYSGRSGSLAIATLAVTDLSKVDRFLKSFNIFASQMLDAARDINAFSLISREIQNAENFGGNSKEEGYTNMMDLRALILSAAPYCRETDNVLKALDEMVIYQVRGTNHTDTCGISVFYPYKVYSAEYMNTAAEICVSPYYLTFIDIQNQGGIYSSVAYDYYNSYIENGQNAETWQNSELNSFEQPGSYNYDENQGVYEYSSTSNPYWNYLDQPVEEGHSPYITFAIPPQVGPDGLYYCQLDEMGRTFAADIKAKVYELNHEERDFIELGETCRIYGSWRDGIFKDGFDGKWLSLPDGQNLAMYVVERQADYVHYASPIRLNGERTFLHLRWYYDGTVIVDGTYSGINENGMAPRVTVPPMRGDEIIPMYYAHNGITYEESLYRGQAYIVDDNLYIVSSYLEAGEYFYNFLITDIYGGYLETEQVNLETDGSGSKPQWGYG